MIAVLGHLIKYVYFRRINYKTVFWLLKSKLFILAGPAIPSVVAYPKRSQTSTADSDLKEDGIPSRKSSGSAVGGKGIAPASPMLGNASNPNKADIPERKKSSTVPSVSIVKLKSIPRIVGSWQSGRSVPLFSSTYSAVLIRPPCPISACRDHLQYLGWRCFLLSPIPLEECSDLSCQGLCLVIPQTSAEL